MKQNVSLIQQVDMECFATQIHSYVKITLRYGPSENQSTHTSTCRVGNNKPPTFWTSNVLRMEGLRLRTKENYPRYFTSIVHTLWDLGETPQACRASHNTPTLQPWKLEMHTQNKKAPSPILHRSWTVCAVHTSWHWERLHIQSCKRLQDLKYTPRWSYVVHKFRTVKSIPRDTGPRRTPQVLWFIQPHRTGSRSYLHVLLTQILRGNWNT